MKKTIFFVLALIALACATAPTLSGINPYVWEKCTTIVVADTIIDTDSLTVLSKWRPSNGWGDGWEYVLVSGALSGEDHIDSFSVAVRVFALDTAYSTMYYVDVDTLATLVGEPFLLPIGGSILGHAITIKYKAYADDGNLCIMPSKIYLYKRRPYNYTKNK